jgi:hypothetical protein
MHPFIPSNPNPLTVASHADRIAREHHDYRLGLVFSAITAVSLGVMTTKMVLDMIRENREKPRARDRER